MIRNVAGLWAVLAVAGCAHDATCTDAAMEASPSAWPLYWSTRGLTPPLGALLCEPTSSNEAHFVERTADEPAVRAKGYEDVLRKAGWTDYVSAKTPNSRSADEVVIHLERGSEVLFFNVYRVDSVTGRAKPALAAGFTAASKPPAVRR